jgi:hypothetical protein
MSTDQKAVMALQPPGTDASDWAITSAGTFVGDWTTDFDGMVALSMQIRFMWGSGGATVRACLQGSLDGGVSAYDILIADFTTASGVIIASIGAGGTNFFHPGIISDGGIILSGGIADNGVGVDILCDRLRMKIIVTGTYANSTLAARVMAG